MLVDVFEKSIRFYQSYLCLPILINDDDDDDDDDGGSDDDDDDDDDDNDTTIISSSGIRVYCYKWIVIWKVGPKLIKQLTTQTVIHNKADRPMFCTDACRIWKHVSSYLKHKLANLCRTHQYVQGNIVYIKITHFLWLFSFSTNELYLGLECRAQVETFGHDKS